MKYRIALAGHPNSGKTTTFNCLLGTREKEGNWPGTTVARKEGVLSYQGKALSFVDLPGTYSLSAYSIDERIAGDFLIKDKPLSNSRIYIYSILFSNGFTEYSYRLIPELSLKWNERI